MRARCRACAASKVGAGSVSRDLACRAGPGPAAQAPPGFREAPHVSDYATLIGAGAGAVYKGTTGLVLEATEPENRVAMTSALASGIQREWWIRTLPISAWR